MPTYDYVCDACGHEFEAYESIKADPRRTCPKCQADSLRRKIGAGAAILFKGSGFYQTDYRSDSYKKSAQADKPADAAPKGDAAAKTDSSSSTKSEPTKTDSSKPASNGAAR